MEGFDAECYNQIFSEEFPNTKFVSARRKEGIYKITFQSLKQLRWGQTFLDSETLIGNTAPDDVSARLRKRRNKGSTAWKNRRLSAWLMMCCRHYVKIKGLEPHEEKVI